MHLLALGHFFDVLIVVEGRREKKQDPVYGASHELKPTGHTFIGRHSWCRTENCVAFERDRIQRGKYRRVSGKSKLISTPETPRMHNARPIDRALVQGEGKNGSSACFHTIWRSAFPQSIFVQSRFSNCMTYRPQTLTSGILQQHQLHDIDLGDHATQEIAECEPCKQSVSG